MKVLLINQVALVLGFSGSILLAISSKLGVISKDGSVIFTGMDPMEPAEKNLTRVRQSYWRNKFFAPTGWGLLSVSFLLQFIATFY